MKFDSRIKKVGNFESIWSQEEIKNEPMLFNCSIEAAYELGGSITKSFLDKIPGNWYISNPVIDSRVHMLKKSWYPAIPGWHQDDVPRSTLTGQPNYTNPKYHSEHLMGLVNGEICPTRFLIGEVEVPDPDINRVVYEDWSNYIDDNYPSPIPNAAFFEYPKSGEMIQFDWQTFHEATQAVDDGWRWFIRLSRKTDRQANMTNELRKQVQVYLEYPKAGW